MHLKSLGYAEGNKQKAQLQSYVTSVGVHNAINKRKIKLFNDNGELNNGQIDPEQKQEDMKYLREKFGEN